MNKPQNLLGILKTEKDIIKLTKQRTFIGRNKNSQIIINHNTVSKEHAMIEFDEEGNAYIKDLNSSNGTYVNGQKLSNLPQKLVNGDAISFGKEPTVYVFESFKKNYDEKTEHDFNESNQNYDYQNNSNYSHICLSSSFFH